MRIYLSKYICLVVFIFVSTPLYASPEKEECKVVVAKFSLKDFASINARDLPTRGTEVIDVMVEAMAKYVKKNKGFPQKIGDFAAFLEVSSQKLNAFFRSGLAGAPKNLNELKESALKAHPDSFKTTLRGLAKEVATYLKLNFSLPNLTELAQSSELSKKELNLLLGYENPQEGQKKYDPLALINEYYPATLGIVERKLIQLFAAESRLKGRIPSTEEMAMALGTVKEDFEKLVGENGLLYPSMDALRERAKKDKPASFKKVLDTSIFTPEKVQALVEAVKTRSRLVVTTAVSGAPINQGFLASLLRYCEEMDADILVYPANMESDELASELLNHPRIHVITHSIQLSPWWRLNSIPLLAKQINPLMGLKTMGIRGESQIVGSPKMDTEVVPTTNNDLLHHRLMTTGALTDPFYAGGKYISGRTDRKAKEDHRMGAIILEKGEQNKEFIEMDTAGHFHTRHIEYIPEKEGFLDLDRFYTAENVEVVKPKGLILGDIHVGDFDELLVKSIVKQLLRIGPKKIFLHDVLNGHTISHHERDQVVTMAQRGLAGTLDLEAELSNVVRFINALLKQDPEIEVVIVPSNHDFWLHRWLQDGKFIQREPQNAVIGVELLNNYMRGLDPLEYALRNGGQEFVSRDPRATKRNQETLLTSGGISDQNRVVFLKRGHGLTIGPKHRLVQVGLHGDKGSKGARGSLKSFEAGNDRIVYGHTHTSARRNGAVNVGTNTTEVLQYSKEGMSNWQQSIALVGPNGEIQVLEFKEGSWYSTPNSVIEIGPHFFVENYPIVIPNDESIDGVGQIDQYSSR